MQKQNRKEKQNHHSSRFSLDVAPSQGASPSRAAAAARLRKLPLHGRSLGGSRAGTTRDGEMKEERIRSALFPINFRLLTSLTFFFNHKKTKKLLSPSPPRGAPRPLTEDASGSPSALGSLSEALGSAVSRSAASTVEHAELLEAAAARAPTRPRRPPRRAAGADASAAGRWPRELSGAQALGGSGQGQGEAGGGGGGGRAGAGDRGGREEKGEEMKKKCCFVLLRERNNSGFLSVPLSLVTPPSQVPACAN